MSCINFFNKQNLVSTKSFQS